VGESSVFHYSLLWKAAEERHCGQHNKNKLNKQYMLQTICVQNNSTTNLKNNNLAKNWVLKLKRK